MTVTATELKTGLGAYLDGIAAGGEDLYITKNGKMIAVISSANKSTDKAFESLELLMTLGLENTPSKLSELSDAELKELHMREKYGEYFD